MLSAVRGAVNGLVLIGVGEGLVLGISYTACGVPHAVVLGVLTGIVAAIPFGVFVMFGLGTVVLFAQSSPGAAIALFGIGTAVLIIADYFVRPLVIGNAAKLPFLWVLFGILGGLESFGLLGLFLGPAVLTCLLALWRELPHRPKGITSS
jgi:predicted PurR-regulated permease PerM